jgi:DNA (cytosine-5)-methyltransferase 1
MKVLDIFSGSGGFSLGFKLAGYNIIGAIEEDKWAAETFQFNMKDANVLIGDIQKFSDDYLLEQFKDNKPDIILGGPPCQGFSICNKDSGNFKDIRNSLFQEFLRLGRIFSPDYLIMENVPNLVNSRTKSKDSILKIIVEELENLRYHVNWKILEATEYGIPQIRRRLFIIASKHQLKHPFPQPTHYLPESGQLNYLSDSLKICPTLWEAISDLPDIEASEGEEEMNYDKKSSNSYQTQMRLGSSNVYNHVAMKHTKRTVERFAAMSWGDSLHDVPKHLRPYKRNGQGQISEKIYDQNSRCLHPHRPCHTIPASFYANFVHPYKNRNFTAREGARIQSFPDWFVFKGKPTVVSHKLLEREGRLAEKHLCQYNQIGNAVPPLLAQAIASNLMEEF